MDILIIARHAKCNQEDGRITEHGIAETQALAAALKQAVGDLSVRVISSNALRATQTADIIASAFGRRSAAFPELAIDEFYEGERLDAAAKILDLEGADHQALIAVTHHDTTAGIILLFQRRIRRAEPALIAPLKNSHAYILDCKTGEIVSQL